MDNLCSYSVIRDIDYTKTLNKGNNRDNYRSFFIKSKTYLDIFLPNSWNGNGNNRALCRNTKKTARPLVVFAYGGGWRRGDKQTWRHYISRWDINLFLAAKVGWNRLYSNVGESFASSGIPCAVLSYPLVPTPFPINVFEMLCSYLLTTALVTLLSLLMFIFILLVDILISVMFSNELLSNRLWTVPQSYSKFPALTLITGIPIFAQLLTLAIIIIREQCHGWKSVQNRPFLNKITKLSVLMGFVLLISIGNVNFKYFRTSSANIVFVIAGILSVCVQFLVYHFQQLTTFSNLQQSKSTMADPEYQAECIAQAVKWLTDYGRTTGQFDPYSVILFGHSAGGHLASLISLDHHYLRNVGVSPKVIKGVITMSAVFDLSTLAEGLLYHAYLKPAFGMDPTRWTRMSPIRYVNDEKSWENSEHPRVSSPSSPPLSVSSSTSRSSPPPLLISQPLHGSQASSSLPSLSVPSSTTPAALHSPSQSLGSSTSHKPCFLIISAERDFKFMIKDSSKMYDALSKYGYIAVRKFMSGCNHFTMIEKFGSPWYHYWSRFGRTQEWTPSDAEIMCRSFVEETCQQS